MISDKQWMINGLVLDLSSYEKTSVSRKHVPMDFPQILKSKNMHVYVDWRS